MDATTRTTRNLHEPSATEHRTLVVVPDRDPRPDRAPLVLGGRDIVLIGGPCAVEGRDMLLKTARAVRAAGARLLRGGAFKPRTSPYSFRGMGQEALELLAEARAETGLAVVTEVLDTRQVELVARYADVFQIGARNMQNFALLAEVGRTRTPVVLKRGLSATIDEFLMAAEHVMAAGNPNVVLCERGIRTFETKTRNTLDVSAVPVLRRETHLPVFVDPSHAAGRAHYVIPLALAAVAAGADGLLVEVHPDPGSALSDGEQSLTPKAFTSLVRRVAAVAHALGRDLDAGGVPRETEPGSANGAGSTVEEPADQELVAPLDALAHARHEIELVDREMVALLARRVALARRAGRSKRNAGVPIIDPVQEAAVLERTREFARAAGLPYRDLRTLLRGMIAVSRRAQLLDADEPSTNDPRSE